MATLFEPAAPVAPGKRRDFTRFDLGVCPGCRGLRSVSSPECTACGNAAPVAADA